MQEHSLKSLFLASLSRHLSFLLNHFICMGSKAVFVLTLTSSSTLIKALFSTWTSGCDFFFISHLLKNHFFPSLPLLPPVITGLR